MISRSQARELSRRRPGFEKKAIARFFVRCRRSGAPENRVKRNRHCGDDSITEMEYRPSAPRLHNADRTTGVQLRLGRAGFRDFVRPPARNANGITGNEVDTMNHPPCNIPRGMLLEQRRWMSSRHHTEITWPRDGCEERPAIRHSPRNAPRAATLDSPGAAMKTGPVTRNVIRPEPGTSQK
jgi:hypothetical protein